MANGNHRRTPLLLPVVLALLCLGPAQAQPTIESLREDAQASPEVVDVWVNLGNGLLLADRYEEAKDAFLEAVAIDYRDGDAHFGLGLAEFGRGDLEAALFAFNEVTRLHPERFDGHYNRGVTLARLGRPGDAAEAFREAVAQAEPEAAPEEIVAALEGLAGQLVRGGEFAAAAEAYAQALEFELPPERSDDLRYRWAEALYRAGEGLEALPELTELEARSLDFRANALISDIYLDQGQVDYALRALERGVRNAGEAGLPRIEANLLVRLGLLQRGLGRQADASASFVRAAQIDPESWEALYNLGVSQLETGQPASAAESLERAVAIPGAHGSAWLAYATALEQLGRTVQALEAARTAVGELGADGDLVAQARMIEGRALYRQGNLGAARQVFENVVDERPGDPQAQLWAGLVAYGLGEYGQAAQYYERAVQLAPGNLEARANLGAAYLAGERFRDAQAVYQGLVEMNPEDGESYYNLGWSLMSQNQRAAAREAWQRASELGHAPAAQALADYF